MRTYIDRKGGLTVEKHESKPNTINKVESVNKTEPKMVSAVDMISTIESYLVSAVGTNNTVSGKGTCVFCGKQTAYANRTVCVDCFKQNKNKIMDGFKNAVQDVDFKIE